MPVSGSTAIFLRFGGSVIVRGWLYKVEFIVKIVSQSHLSFPSSSGTSTWMEGRVGKGRKGQGRGGRDGKGGGKGKEGKGRERGREEGRKEGKEKN